MPAFCFGAAGVEDHAATHQGSKPMRNEKAAGLDADVLERIAQIEQMTLDQIAAFQPLPSSATPLPK
jgi:hypothetical protein